VRSRLCSCKTAQNRAGSSASEALPAPPPPCVMSRYMRRILGAGCSESSECTSAEKPARERLPGRGGGEVIMMCREMKGGSYDVFER
jgi:hypothetical protein